MSGRIVGHCLHRYSSRPGDVCGITLMETPTLNWPGHSSPPKVAHYPISGRDHGDPPPAVSRSEMDASSTVPARMGRSATTG